MAVRVHSIRKSAEGLRERVERLDHLPIRPDTARIVMKLAADAPDLGDLDWARYKSSFLLDPGWVAAESTPHEDASPVAFVARSTWWPSSNSSGARAEVFQRLWRHSVAVSVAARSLARDAGEPDPERLARAGLIHGLGRWAVAAVDPDWIARWLNEPDLRVRQRMELTDLGTDLGDLGRRLAERWGCEPLIVDAAWLHGGSCDDLNQAGAEPALLRLIQQAVRFAELTPWALAPAGGREAMSSDPRLRILVAEVQSRCGSLFTPADATSHEERMTRVSASLAIRLEETSRRIATQERLLQAFARSEPAETSAKWSERAGMVWCLEPDVTAARVDWLGNRDRQAADRAAEGLAKGPSGRDPSPSEERPPAVLLPLRMRGKVVAEVRLWCGQSPRVLTHRLDAAMVIPAWEAWAARVAHHELNERRLRVAVSAVRQILDGEEVRLGEAKREALAEFAAGAGHELNNPLAVIVGRAQLILGKTEDQETARSLRIILGQAQRAHRILRDLMFVARPPAPRPRACRPADLIRSCLNDFREDAMSRGVELAGDSESTEAQTWADPDALRHVTEILIRNAIQATPPGGRVHVRSSRQGKELRWWVCDGGKGISSTEGAHLFDPFYCGRQAGRGLGLGLPRAARIIALAGGSLTWSSSAGQGTVFQVQVPLTPPPEHETFDSELSRS